MEPAARNGFRAAFELQDNDTVSFALCYFREFKNTNLWSTLPESNSSLREALLYKQARKPRSYASLKLRLTDSLTDLLTGVKCRATSVANKKGYKI